MAVNPITISLVDGISKGLASISDGVTGLGANFVKLNSSVELFEKGLSFIGSAASGIGDLITPAADLEDALASVQAVTGATAQEFDALKAAAEGAAERTRFSAIEAAGGLAELARAGYSATAAIDALNPTLAIAQGNNISVAQSAELLSTAITQFGLAATDANRVADVLQKTADGTSTSVEQLGLALSYAAPGAKALGFSIEETSAAIGVLANNGLRGERAGTALREVFAQLQTPTSALNKAMSEAGVSVGSLSEFLAAVGNDSALAQKAMAALGVSGQGLKPLFDDAGKTVSEFTRTLENAAGTAQRTSDIMGATFNAALAKLQNAFTNAQASLLEPLLKPLADELNATAAELVAFTKTVEFTELSERIKEFTLIGVSSLREFIKEFDFKAAIAGLNQFIADANTQLNLLKSTFDTVKITIASLETAFYAIAAQVNLTQLAFNGLFFALQKSSQYIASFGSLVRESFGLSTESVDNFAQSMQDAAEVTAGDAKRNLDELGVALDNLGNAASGASTGIAETSTNAAAAAQSVAALGNAGEVAGEQIDAGLAEAIRKANSGIFTAADSANKLKTALDAAFEGKKTLADAQALRDQLAPIFQKLGLDVGLVNEALKKFGEGLAADELAKRFSEASSKINDIIGGLITGAEDAQEKFNAAFKGLFDGATEEQATQLRVAISREMLEMGASIETVEAAINGLNTELEKSVKAQAIADLSQEFEALGIKSKAALDELAKKAESSFDAIVKSVRATNGPIEDIRAAFIAFARTQLDAVKNADEFKRAQVIAALESKAAASGLTESLVELGIVGKDASEKVAKGVQSIKPAADDAAASVQGVSSAMANAGANATAAAGAIQGNTSALVSNGQAAEEAGYFIGGLSEAMAEQFRRASFSAEAINQLNRQLIEGRNRASEYADALREQIAALDPLEAKVRAIKNRFRELDDETARSIAQLEQRAEQLRGGGTSGAPGTGGGTQTTNSFGGGSPLQSGGVTVNLSLSALDPGSLDRNTLLDLARQLTGPLRQLNIASS